MTGRRVCLCLIVALPACAAGCSGISADERLVNLAEVDPRIVLDVRYATADNFLKEPVYPVARCLLRECAARRLRRVQDDLAARGMGLKVYDAYRPLSVQRRMWAVMPDPKYVADPANGSRHNRGAAVDVTLVDSAGRELSMPCPYDEFSPRADREYRGGTPEERNNRRILEKAMRRQGFIGLDSEWWHFDARGWERYPVLDVPLESAAR